jgi:orotidine-5'-phosphate decarboxylase
MASDEASSSSSATGARARIGTQASDRLVFALDVPALAEAEALIELLHREVGVFKVGLELFTAAGPAALRAAHARGRRVFLDLKLHDIPATVERAVAAAASLGAAYLTVHAAGGPEMLQAAARAARGTELTLLAVTVLTSADEHTLAAIGIAGPMPDAVSRLARLAIDNGIQGLVCSAAECARLRRELGDEVILVTPGVRLQGDAAQDQKRVATPSAALAAGADLIVVGRPIRDAASPLMAAGKVVQEIARAL